MKDGMQTILETENCSLYLCQTFGITLIKCRRLLVGEGPYAQYPKALYAEWVEKGKRKARRSWETYKPFVLVLAGHDNPNPDGPMVDLGISNGCQVSRTRYSSCDNRYRTDFNDLVAPHLDNGAVVLFDRRVL